MRERVECRLIQGTGEKGCTTKKGKRVIPDNEWKGVHREGEKNASNTTEISIRRVARQLTVAGVGGGRLGRGPFGISSAKQAQEPITLPRS